MQKWLRSLKMSVSTNERASRTFGVLVSTTMLLLTGKVHDGCSVRAPSTSTRHMRQAPYGDSCLWSHSTGMLNPAASAARRTVVPSGTLISLPSILRLTMLTSSTYSESETTAPHARSSRRRRTGRLSI